MLDDILDFATTMLVDGGRLCMWMPTANDEDIELAIPTHPCLELVSVSVQPFNKCTSLGCFAIDYGLIQPGSRRLLTYSRRPDTEVDLSLPRVKRENLDGGSANDLNAFRRKVSLILFPIVGIGINLV